MQSPLHNNNNCSRLPGRSVPLQAGSGEMLQMAVLPVRWSRYRPEHDVRDFINSCRSDDGCREQDIFAKVQCYRVRDN